MFSPDETYHLWVTAFEVRMSQWVNSFLILHVPTETPVFSLEGTLWSIEGPSFEGNVLSATLREYPGTRPALHVAFHLDERKAVVDGKEHALEALETALRGK